MNIQSQTDKNSDKPMGETEKTKDNSLQDKKSAQENAGDIEKPDLQDKKTGVERNAPAGLRAIMGRKLGMTQIFDSYGNLHSASVIEAGPCPIVNVRTVVKDGYNAVCLGFEEIAEKKVNKPMSGYFKKIKIAPLGHLQEYRLVSSDGFETGQLVTLSGRFNAGDYVDVSGVTKGKGFAGVMKRYNFRGLPASHGASDKERSPGSISSQRSLGRVIPGQKMPGHMGQKKVTIAKLEVLKIDNEKNLIYVNGSVPGAKGTIVSILETSKPKKKREIKARTKKGKK